MKISLNWLRELLFINYIDPEKLAYQLTLAGLEVEGIEDRQSWADGVVIGKVLDRQPHPNATKLSICQVDIGQANPSTIVCGASNVRANIYVPIATLGAYLPKVDLTIKPTTLRGVESSGMICSLAELGLAKESEGIHIFTQEDLVVGSDVRPLLGLDDVIIEISPTANRADALSMIGIAREVAALVGVPVTLPSLHTLGEFSKTNGILKVELDDDQICPIYQATLIEGVIVAPSPFWLQTKLQSAGIKPINNIVDITNYVLLEWGQPLHAFDLDSVQDVAGDKHVRMGARYARNTESLKTLDGQSRNLTADNLLITANNCPVAIAGVMGGKETEVHSNTRSIILESAIFESTTIRRSAKSQGLRTEASSRYEKGVNLQALESAWQRAINLIQEIAGGSINEIVTVDFRHHQQQSPVELRFSRIQDILGKIDDAGELRHLREDEIEKVLNALGCSIQFKQDHWLVNVPSHRAHDLLREIDLIEEIARIFGYDHFSYTLPQSGQLGTLGLEESLQHKIREAFRAVGLNEVIHYSLVKPTGKEVLIANPLLAEYAALRCDLLSGLIEAFEYNFAQGNGSLNAFEIGRIFIPEKENIIIEEDLLAGIIGGDLFSFGSWSHSGKSQPISWYQAKGFLESVLGSLGLNVSYQKNVGDLRFHPGRTASLWQNEIYLGRFGQIHPQLTQASNLPDAIYIFELHLSPILRLLSQPQNNRTIYKQYSTYPSLERDIAFYAPLEISVAQLEKTMNSSGKDFLEKIELFDQYQGDNVPSGQRSLAFSLFYRVDDRTLKDTEVEPVHNKIREALVKEHQVTLRS
jgi:phenylalanyl-tRNA synthetase beta chain